MVATPDVLAAARRVADEVLRPAASDVDRTGVLPAGHLDAAASEGLYGVAGPTDAGGAGADRGTAHQVTELLAAACLSTAFVLVQHQGVVSRLSRSGPTWDPWVRRMSAGQVRAGVGVGGVRPGAEPLRATPDGDGWLLEGTVPWVTGWGLVDVLHVAALDPAGDVVWLLLDAVAAPTMNVDELALTAVRASRTVTVTFHRHPAPGDRLTGRTTYAQWQAADVGTLRGNGSLSLGLVARSAAEIGDDAADLLAATDRLRAELDAADGAADAERLARARAAASGLAWTAAGRLAVAGGAGSVVAGGPADRTTREAAFLLVFGSRPAIRSELRARLVPET